MLLRTQLRKVLRTSRDCTKKSEFFALNPPLFTVSNERYEALTGGLEVWYGGQCEWAALGGGHVGARPVHKAAPAHTPTAYHPVNLSKYGGELTKDVFK